MHPKIKICGITTGADAELAARCGADYIGLVCEIPYSPRSITRRAAAELAGRARLPAVLLVDAPVERAIEIALQVRPFGLQLIGNHPAAELSLAKRETGCGIWLPVRLPAAGSARGDARTGLAQYLDVIQRSGCDTVILDTLVRGMKGGTGRSCDWTLAEGIAAASPAPVYLAGGITAHNAARACRQVRPAGIDVSSGVEQGPGVKDPAKIERLVREIRSLRLQPRHDRQPNQGAKSDFTTH
ncbi:MAG: phosphoribosylanthranilate isomerase [Deltaproteobacteria bacterium]|nr:phosphoribosylanthranilate isomerase [Deltaproteobacteria bacterium]